MTDYYEKMDRVRIYKPRTLTTRIVRAIRAYNSRPGIATLQIRAPLSIGHGYTDGKDDIIATAELTRDEILTLITALTECTEEMPRMCECENIAHDPESSTGSGDRVMTPNGNPGHDYGREFCPSYLVNVKTTFGTLELCEDCAKDCAPAALADESGQFTVYQHDRPETCFADVDAAVAYLWPDNPERQQIAREDLESFHETANGPVCIKRSDRYAFLPETEAGLRDWYEGQVGYDPMQDDPTMTFDQLRELSVEYCEAANVTA